MKAALANLGAVAYWDGAWQERVARALPNFCTNPLYVEQDSPSVDEFDRVADGLLGVVDEFGQLRDAEFGARVVNSCRFGPLTRMWLDAQVEVDFLRRHVGELSGLDVLDIGAGYGRLAVMLGPMVRQYLCVDAVPISTELCTWYCGRFAPSVNVASLELFKQSAEQLRPDLAVNIHSWNECPYGEVARWIEVVHGMGTKWLFTVSHGTRGGRTYYTWGGKGDSFRPALERRFTLLAEEWIGIGGHPHALWQRR